MSEETIDGKPQVLRTTVPAKDHPEALALYNRANKLGRHSGNFPIVVDVLPPQK